MKTNKLLLSPLVLAVAIGAPIAGFVGDANVAQPMTSPGIRVPFLHGLLAGQVAGRSELASLERADEWLNSPPLTASALRGKVVLVDFWTYTCINWLRTLPYVRAWDEKYRDQGLVVIGVHAPEFSFEKESEQRAPGRERPADRLPGRGRQRPRHLAGLQQPVLAGAVFHRCAGARPAPPLRRGRVRTVGNGHSGIAGRGRDQRRRPSSRCRSMAAVIEAAADWEQPEVSGKLSRVSAHPELCVAGGAVLDEPHLYEVPARLRLNEWGLSGDWTVKKEAAVLNKPNGSIAYRFHARDLHLVMGPAAPGTSVRFRVLIDGQPPGAAHGTDVDEQGNGTVTEQRLYQLIRQPKPIVDRQFEIEFLGPGVEVFAFTFG